MCRSDLLRLTEVRFGTKQGCTETPSVPVLMVHVRDVRVPVLHSAMLVSMNVRLAGRVLW